MSARTLNYPRFIRTLTAAAVFGLDSKVTVPVKSVEDWVFFRDEQPTGLFSIKALTDIQGERRQRS